MGGNTLVSFVTSIFLPAAVNIPRAFLMAQRALQALQTYLISAAS